MSTECVNRSWEAERKYKRLVTLVCTTPDSEYFRCARESYIQFGMALRSRYLYARSSRTVNSHVDSDDRNSLELRNHSPADLWYSEVNILLWFLSSKPERSVACSQADFGSGLTVLNFPRLADAEKEVAKALASGFCEPGGRQRLSR